MRLKNPWGLHCTPGPRHSGNDPHRHAAHRINVLSPSGAGSIVNSTICSSIFWCITVFGKARGIGGMCENMHAVPVSSYFMFVILVLLTLGLIQYGEPQLSLVRALGGVWGSGGCLCGGNPALPVGCACPRGRQGDRAWQGGTHIPRLS